MNKYLRLSALLLATILIEIGLGRRWGNLPPLGKFLSPVEGFWRNAEPPEGCLPTRISIPTLKDTVRIFWDSRWIPHIFAKNEADLYRIQGYIQAYLRLWQMEVQSDAAAGELSRFLGENLLPLDRAFRRLGTRYAAERALELVRRDSLVWSILTAFTEGVNAYIQTLSPRDYPLEYKLLDYKPRLWSPLRSLFLVKYMAYDLTTPSKDKYLTRLLPLIGKGAIDTLYPNEPPLGHPTVLTYHEPPLHELPPQPEELHSKSYLEDSSAYAIEGEEAFFGSNNWALSGKKTATGYPLLANDPHLALNLPSIWLEMHLWAPTLHVYGVTLQGAPGVIIGYNECIAWGVTNVGPDAMDFYHLRYADSMQRSFYYNGQVLPLTPRAETIWVRTTWGSLRPFIDTVWYTPWGPVVHRSRDAISRPLAGKAREAPADCALRWIAHEPSNEARCFLLLNRAKTLEDFRQALQAFGSPAQNFIYADTSGHIAIWVRGLYPLRWENQGKFVLEAERPEHHWRDWLSMEENPHAIDPPEGFVRSANSYPASKYPYYLGWDFDLPDRAARIEEKLRSFQKADVDSLRLLQLDVENFTARRALPILLSYVADKQSRWLDTLRQWDYRFTAHTCAPTLFKRWWLTFHRLLWKPLELCPPDRDITLKVLEATHQAGIEKKPSLYERWLSSSETGEKTLKALVQRSWEEVQAWAETLPEDSLLWWKQRGTRFQHLLRLPALGSEVLPIAGDAQCVNAISSTAGPSWRMVVSLKPPVQGYGVYPGGQSGNPGSFHYMDFLSTWAEGQLFAHQFHAHPEALQSILHRTEALPAQ